MRLKYETRTKQNMHDIDFCFFQFNLTMFHPIRVLIAFA